MEANSPRSTPDSTGPQECPEAALPVHRESPRLSRNLFLQLWTLTYLDVRAQNQSKLLAILLHHLDLFLCHHCTFTEMSFLSLPTERGKEAFMNAI